MHVLWINTTVDLNHLGDVTMIAAAGNKKLGGCDHMAVIYRKTFAQFV
ncbi:hypothetical protein [Agrobacterium tumefaciens]|nr:hypothetical protein [Agrobacterium tumefaciens]